MALFSGTFNEHLALPLNYTSAQSSCGVRKSEFYTIALLTQQVRGCIAKNHRAHRCDAEQTHTHTLHTTHTIAASHKRMVEKSKIMRKIFSHRSRHTVESRLPYQIQTILCSSVVCVCFLWESIECQVELMYEVIPITTHERSIDDHCTRWILIPY